jgi:hypothetical protein
MQTFDWFQISGEFFNRIGSKRVIGIVRSVADFQRIAGARFNEVVATRLPVAPGVANESCSTSQTQLAPASMGLVSPVDLEILMTAPAPQLKRRLPNSLP